MKNINQIMATLFKYCLSHDKDDIFIENITNEEMARMMVEIDSSIQVFSSCPNCGAEIGCNIDCDMCEIYMVICCDILKEIGKINVDDEEQLPDLSKKYDN